jgi:hypothetical protein
VETEHQELIKEPIEQVYAQHEKTSASERAGALPVRKRSWWWVELWSDKRELVKEAVAHFLLFAGLLGSLEAAHRLLKWSTLPPEELNILNKVHFYMYAIILVIFAFSLIIKVLKSEFSTREK